MDWDVIGESLDCLGWSAVKDSKILLNQADRGRNACGRGYRSTLLENASQTGVARLLAVLRRAIRLRACHAGEESDVPGNATLVPITMHPRTMAREPALTAKLRYLLRSCLKSYLKAVAMDVGPGAN
jgi:hypothetical protein